MTSKTERIVIVGGGAGGLELAVKLAKNGHDGVLLIDNGETHVWKPRLHELAAGMRRGHVDEMEYTGLAEHWGFAFEQGRLVNIDPANSKLTLAAAKNDNGDTLVPERDIAYRALVLALGGVTPDMGIDGVLEHAILLDREHDAETLSRHFSAALLARSMSGETQPVNVIIIGSGLTGVELAAHLATDAVCASLAPKSALPDIKITVLEAAGTFMPGMQDKVRDAVRQRLSGTGIDIITGQQVRKVSLDTVETDDGRMFDADLVVWATGRVGPPAAGDIKALSTNKKRQWRVRKTLQSIDSDAIFALGDCACMDDDPAPPTAQAASEQAAHLATELPSYLQGETPQPFEFQDKGTLLSLGEAGSIGTIRDMFGDDLQIRGRPARAAYRGLQRQHRFILLGAAKGTAELVGDLFGRAGGPRLKIH